jgi:tetratricopeptide (TPR) repeat protein
MEETMKKVLPCLVLVVLAACAGPEKPRVVTLAAPAGTPPAAAAAVEEGNRLFAQKQWEPAKAQYETAIKIHPELAEAHYDLGLTLDRLGDKPAALKHYKAAADLAPGNQVIWNAPPFRHYSEDIDRHSLGSKDKAYMDPKKGF